MNDESNESGLRQRLQQICDIVTYAKRCNSRPETINRVGPNLSLAIQHIKDLIEQARTDASE